MTVPASILLTSVSAIYTRQLSSRFIYSYDEAGPVSVLACAGVISLLAVFAAAFYFSVTRRSKTKHRTNLPPYLVSLFFSNILQSIATIINAKWAVQSFVEEGGLCSFQAILKNLANVGTAIWNLVIAAHVFNLLFLRWETTRASLIATLVGGWSFVLLIVSIGPIVIQNSERGPYFGVAEYWCWITSGYPTERLFAEYFIEFLSAGFGFLFYATTLLRCRGNLIKVDGRWKLRWISSGESWKLHIGKDMIDAAMLRVVSSMVWYPVAYGILIIPVALARFMAFSGKHVPFWATITTDTMFNLTGLVNTLLFIFTRRILPDTAILPDFTTQRPDLFADDIAQDDLKKQRVSTSSSVDLKSHGLTPFTLPKLP